MEFTSVASWGHAAAIGAAHTAAVRILRIAGWLRMVIAREVRLRAAGGRGVAAAPGYQPTVPPVPKALLRGPR